MFSNAQNLLITGGTFTIHHHAVPDRLFDHITQAAAPRALHNSGERFDKPKCHPCTRVAILRHLKDWLIGSMHPESFVLWLYGAAGAGKSAIAQSFAESCYSEGCLCATFFFSKSDETRRIVKPLVPTILYQLSVSHPRLRPIVEEVVDADPMIFDKSLDHQLEQLVIRSLLQISSPNVASQLIVIDGLDECQDSAAQSQVITSLFFLAKKLNNAGFPLRILIASRPEQHLLTTFDFEGSRHSLARIALNDTEDSAEDIRLFLVDKFEVIKRSHPLRHIIQPSWPGASAIQTLVTKSSGQFIYANLAIQFISSIHHSPVARLDAFLDVRPAPENQDMPFAELDAIYSHFMSSVPDTRLALDLLGVFLITSTIVRAIPAARGGLWIGRHHPLHTVHGIASLLDTSVDPLYLCVSSLSSIMDCSPDGYITVRHASLVDFLRDPRRSKDFHISGPQFQLRILELCLNKVDRADHSLPVYHWIRALVPHARLSTRMKRRLGGFDMSKARSLIFSTEGTLMAWDFLAGFYLEGLILTEDHLVHRDYIDQQIREALSCCMGSPEISCCLIAFAKRFEYAFGTWMMVYQEDFMIQILHSMTGAHVRLTNTAHNVIRSLSSSSLQDYLVNFLQKPARCGRLSPEPDLFVIVCHHSLRYSFGQSGGGVPAHEDAMKSLQLSIHFMCELVHPFPINLACLPTFLNKASHSEELIAYVNSGTLAHTLARYIEWEKQLSGLMKAIGARIIMIVEAIIAYLSKCGVQRNQTLRRLMVGEFRIFG